jgi:hypothetical protein
MAVPKSAPDSGPRARVRDAVHVARGVIGGGFALLIAAAVLGYDRVDLCNAHFEGCGTGGHPTRAVVSELLLVVVAVGAFWGAVRLRRSLGGQVARDAVPWLRHAYLALLWLGVFAVLAVFVVLYVASLEPQRLPGLPDPDVTVSRWAAGIALAIAAFLPVRFYVDLQNHREVGRATSGSPVTPGLRRFTGSVVEAPQAPGGVVVPRSGERVAAWAVEALMSSGYERETTRGPAFGQDPSDVQRTFEDVTVARWWELLWASPEPVAVSTPEGIVLVDTAGVDVEGDQVWRDASIPFSRELYPKHEQDLKDRGTYEYRVTAVPFGASVEVSGKVVLRDGVPWLVAARMPSRPQGGIPPTYVRRDGLRNLLQTVRRAAEPRSF